MYLRNNMSLLFICFYKNAQAFSVLQMYKIVFNSSSCLSNLNLKDSPIEHPQKSATGEIFQIGTKMVLGLNLSQIKFYPLQ